MLLFREAEKRCHTPWNNSIKKKKNPSTRQTYTDIEIQSISHAVPLQPFKIFITCDTLQNIHTRAQIIRAVSTIPRGLKGERMPSRVQWPKTTHKAALRHVWGSQPVCTDSCQRSLQLGKEKVFSNLTAIEHLLFCLACNFHYCMGEKGKMTY